MDFQKTKYIVFRGLLLVVFLFVLMKPTIFTLISTPNNHNELQNADVIEITGGSSCGLTVASCCCDISVTDNNHDCCCKSLALGKDSVDLVVKASDGKFFNAIINSIKCSDVSYDLQIGSLSDYNPLPLTTLLFCLPKGDFQIVFKDCYSNESHLVLPFTPPRYIS